MLLLLLLSFSFDSCNDSCSFFNSPFSLTIPISSSSLFFKLFTCLIPSVVYCSLPFHFSLLTFIHFSYYFICFYEILPSHFTFSFFYLIPFSHLYPLFLVVIFSYQFSLCFCPCLCPWVYLIWLKPSHVDSDSLFS